MNCPSWKAPIQLSQARGDQLHSKLGWQGKCVRRLWLSKMSMESYEAVEEIIFSSWPLPAFSGLQMLFPPLLLQSHNPSPKSQHTKDATKLLSSLAKKYRSPCSRPSSKLSICDVGFCHKFCDLSIRMIVAADYLRTLHIWFHFNYVVLADRYNHARKAWSQCGGGCSQCSLLSDYNTTERGAQCTTIIVEDIINAEAVIEWSICSGIVRLRSSDSVSGITILICLFFARVAVGGWCGDGMLKRLLRPCA